MTMEHSFFLQSALTLRWDSFNLLFQFGLKIHDWRSMDINLSPVNHCCGRDIARTGGVFFLLK